MVKTDDELEHDVLEEFRGEPRIDIGDITVIPQNGVVTLFGFVRNYAESYAAEKAALRVIGVKGVANDLQIKPCSVDRRTDTDIAQAAVRLIEWHVLVPTDRIKVAVAYGWVTLEGSVDWQYQKEAAEDAVRHLTGVRGMSNLIWVEPTVSPKDVNERVEKRLKGNARTDESRITVEPHGDSVVLQGTARSRTDRQEAERATWSEFFF